MPATVHVNTGTSAFCSKRRLRALHRLVRTNKRKCGAGVKLGVLIDVGGRAVARDSAKASVNMAALTTSDNGNSPGAGIPPASLSGTSPRQPWTAANDNALHFDVLGIADEWLCNEKGPRQAWL